MRILPQRHGEHREVSLFFVCREIPTDKNTLPRRGRYLFSNRYLASELLLDKIGEKYRDVLCAFCVSVVKIALLLSTMLDSIFPTNVLKYSPGFYRRL